MKTMGQSHSPPPCPPAPPGLQKETSLGSLSSITRPWPPLGLLGTEPSAVSCQYSGLSGATLKRPVFGSTAKRYGRFSVIARERASAQRALTASDAATSGLSPYIDFRVGETTAARMARIATTRTDSNSVNPRRFVRTATPYRSGFRVLPLPPSLPLRVPRSDQPASPV